MQKRDWAIVALCLAASILFGIYGIKLAVDYRSTANAPSVVQPPRN
jgi:hypothetical protein